MYACRRVTHLPIVGMGGVCNGRDALELIACGATHVALGTVLFSDNTAAERVRAELDEAAADIGLTHPDDAFCAAHETVVRVAN